MDVCVNDESGDFSIEGTDALRLACHRLIQQLPSVAFNEAIETLHEIQEFYRHPPAKLETQPPQKIAAQIAASQLAPVFPLTEE